MCDAKVSVRAVRNPMLPICRALWKLFYGDNTVEDELLLVRSRVDFIISDRVRELEMEPPYSNPQSGSATADAGPTVSFSRAFCTA